MRKRTLMTIRLLSFLYSSLPHKKIFQYAPSLVQYSTALQCTTAEYDVSWEVGTASWPRRRGQHV